MSSALPKWPWHDLRWWWLILPFFVIIAALLTGEAPTLSAWSLGVLEQMLKGLGAIKVVETILRARPQPEPRS